MTQPLAEGPTNVRTYKDGAPFPPRLCLDANVILDLHEHHLASSGLLPRHRGHPDLAACLDRMQKAGCTILVTPLALEEVFHILAGRLLVDAYKKCHCCAKEKELLQNHPPEQAAVRRKAILGLREAVLAAARKGAKIALPTKDVDGVQAHQTFTALLQNCMGIGGKDALHIVFGGLLESTAFLSRDAGFCSIPAITVFAKHMPR
jgi:hypothetical protein